MNIKPFRVYRRVLAEPRYVSSHPTFQEAEREARLVGGYVVARKQVWHEDSAAASLSTTVDQPNA